MPTRSTLLRRGGAAATVALLAATTGCSISSTAPDATTPLMGSWTWVRSTGGLLPHDRTPQSEGYDMTLVFGGDGTVQLSFDDSFGGRTWYEVGLGSSRGSLGGVPVIRYGEALFGFQEQAYDFAARDSLVLHDGCCDGFAWHFVRESGS